MADDTRTDDGSGEHAAGRPTGANGVGAGSPGPDATTAPRNHAGTTAHRLFGVRAGEARPGTVAEVARSVFARLVAGLDWVLARFTSPTVWSALFGLLLYRYMNSDAVRVLPFDGPGDGTALAVRLGQMLDAVDSGARAGIDTGLDGFKCTTTKPPDQTIPGTGISLSALLGWGETQVRGQVIDEGTQHRVRLQLTGRKSGLVETDPRNSVDEAIVEGAERLYALIVPVNGAYYYFSRYPDRALDLVQRLLDDDHPTTAVHRVWGLALRDLGDVDGALEAFHAADAQAKSAKEHARLHLEMGYAARAAKRWPAAVDYFDRAAEEDPTWLVPVLRKGDALRASGDLAGALAAYERAGTLKSSLADAWVGIGHIHADAGEHALAYVAYETARRYAFDARQRASLLRDEADVLFDLGCADQAVSRYARAMQIGPTYERQRGARAGGACPTASPTNRDVPGCLAYEPAPATG
jgi:tetratricopeptide (TPR) repeat protein